MFPNKGKAFQTTLDLDGINQNQWDLLASNSLRPSCFNAFADFPSISSASKDVSSLPDTARHTCNMDLFESRNPLEIRSKQCVGKNASKNDRSCIFGPGLVDEWKVCYLFPELYRCNNKPKPKSKRSTVKVLVCYYHTATYTQQLVEVSCNHAAVGGQDLEPQSFGRGGWWRTNLDLLDPSMHPTSSK